MLHRCPLTCVALGCLAASCAGPGERAITAYTGQYVDSALVDEILISQEVNTLDGYLAALAFAERFHTFADGDGQWEWEGQFAQHFGDQDHQEINALAVLRWNRFPWSESLRTSAAIGEGLSLATELPPLEAADEDNEGTNELLNYILLEATFGLPSTPNWDFVLRIHHRSGVFGLFDGVSGGSNVLAVGIKYTF
ncbi:MAG: hypothetical protein AAFZ65_16300 [Planctomycetota bacterium]